MKYAMLFVIDILFAIILSSAHHHMTDGEFGWLIFGSLFLVTALATSDEWKEWFNM